MKQLVRLLQKQSYKNENCAWRESNPRQTRFRKPPLYPTELQAQICLFNCIFDGDGSVRQPANIANATLLYDYTPKFHETNKLNIIFRLILNLLLSDYENFHQYCYNSQNSLYIAVCSHQIFLLIQP